jgi:hypothetical protein
MRPRWATVVAAATICACSGGAHHVATTSTAVTPTTNSPTAATARPSGPASSTATATTVATGPVTDLVAVDVAHHPGYDRVVFRFDGAAPSAAVTVAHRPITEDASGREIAVAGRSLLRVVMTIATASTYAGPKRIDPGTPEVVELVQAGDFEGYLTWVIGRNDMTNYSQFVLSSPSRIVIDIRTP